MAKETGKKESAHKKATDKGFLLERRASPKRKTSTKIESRRPLTVEAFQETLGRYCRRYQKDGRDFTISSISILEYKNSSDVEKDELDKVIVSMLFGFLRSEDRICFVEPAHYLVLMPGTSYEDATRAMKRVAEKIGATKIQTRNSVLHPSAFARSVSACLLDIHSSHSGAPLDSQSLLSQIGYTFDRRGRITFIETSENGHSEPLFRGGLHDWLSRFKDETKAAAGKHAKSDRPDVIVMRDTWNGNHSVDIRTLKLPVSDHVTAGGAHFGNLLRRLRVLQNLDHPGVSRLCDFYIDREMTVFLVNQRPEGVELTGKTKIDPNGSDPETELENWMQQILNALIALQTVVPSVVPSSFQEMRVFLCDDGGKNGGKIVLMDYDCDYLKGALLPGSDKYDRVSTSGQKELMSGLIEFILRLREDLGITKKTRFAKFLAELSQNELNTPYKVRNQLKQYQDAARI